jgi:hypothetical protein
MPIGRYPQALVTIVRGSAVPYGYTLTIWTTGAALEHGHGTPGIGDIFMFLGGAIAGFVLVAAAGRQLADQPLEKSPDELTWTGMMQLGAVALALGAGVLVALISGPAAWPLAAFAATVAYLLLAALELASVDRVRSTQQEQVERLRAIRIIVAICND